MWRRGNGERERGSKSWSWVIFTLDFFRVCYTLHQKHMSFTALVDKMRKSIFRNSSQLVYIWFVHSFIGWYSGRVFYSHSIFLFSSFISSSVSVFSRSIFRLILISLHTKANLIVSFSITECHTYTKRYTRKWTMMI